MANIPSIKVGNTTYNLKDVQLRDDFTAFDEKTLTYRRKLTSSDDIHNIDSPGMYYIEPASSSGTPLNYPFSPAEESRLLVIKATTASNHYSEMHFLISSNALWVERCIGYNVTTGVYRWSPWMKLTDNRDALKTTDLQKVSELPRRYANNASGNFTVFAGGITSSGSFDSSFTNRGRTNTLIINADYNFGYFVKMADDTYTIHRIWLYESDISTGVVVGPSTPIRAIIAAGQEVPGSTPVWIPPADNEFNTFAVSFSLTSDPSHVMTSEDLAAISEKFQVYSIPDTFGMLNDRTLYTTTKANFTYSFGGFDSSGRSIFTRKKLRYKDADTGLGAFHVGPGSVITPNDGYFMDVAVYKYYNSNEDNKLLSCYMGRTTPLTINNDRYVRIAFGTTDNQDLCVIDEDKHVTLTEAGEAALEDAITVSLYGGTVKDELNNLKNRSTEEVFFTVKELKEEIPLTAVDYHDLLYPLVEAGKLTRTLLGNVDDDETLPIYLYTLRSDMNHMSTNYSIVSWDGSNELYERPNIFISSGLHGNERSTPFALYSFIDALCNDIAYQDMKNGHNWYFIPIVNPWGFSHTAFDISTGTANKGAGYTSSTISNYRIEINTSTYHYGCRCNKDGVDINRDFTTFATEEAQMVRDALLDITGGQQTLFFAMDAHQAAMNDGEYKTGAFLSLHYGATSAEKNNIYDKWMRSGGKTEAIMAEYCDVENIQTIYPWNGSNLATLRNYLHNYATHATCFESGQACTYYSNSKEYSNEITRTFTNTCMHLFLHEIAK